MTKPKILLVSPLPPPIGGIASWTLRYKEWMTTNNHDFELVNNAIIGNRKIQSFSLINFLQEIKRNFLIIKNFKKMVKFYKPNILHLNSACSKYGIIRDYLCVKIAKKKNIKVIVHYRCNVEDQIHNRFSNTQLKKMSKLADLNIVLNIPSKAFITKNTDKCVIIPNFIDNELLTLSSKVINETIERISFLGHLTKNKGIYEIFAAAKAFPNIQFIVAGPMLEDFSGIELADNIKLVGVLSKEDSKQLLINSDVFLFPSYSEGFSNALLEAMAIGLPIITTPVGANKEMIENFGGYIVNIGDYHDIIDKIFLIQAKEVRIQMSLWNRKKVYENYTTDIVMEQLMRTYVDVLDY